MLIAGLSARMGKYSGTQKPRNHTDLRGEAVPMERYPKTREPRNHTALRRDSEPMERHPETGEPRDHMALRKPLQQRESSSQGKETQAEELSSPSPSPLAASFPFLASPLSNESHSRQQISKEIRGSRMWRDESWSGCLCSPG